MQQGEWTRSSYCDNSGGSCVEVMRVGDEYRVRDGKLGDASPVLVFNKAEMEAFALGAAHGEF